MRKFLEMEAELGSENDDEAVKAIDRDDAEENEEGHDGDLKGFVVHEEERGDEEEMMQKVMDDRQRDDKAETAKIYSSIFLGNNRKRKRGELDCDDEEQGPSKRRVVDTDSEPDNILFG
jgi:hypothetical protein